MRKGKKKRSAAAKQASYLKHIKKKERKAKKWEESVHPTFTVAEQEEIKMYQREIRGIPEVKIVCWHCGKEYAGKRCPFCNAFLPRESF